MAPRPSADDPYYPRFYRHQDPSTGRIRARAALFGSPASGLAAPSGIARRPRLNPSRLRLPWRFVTELHPSQIRRQLRQKISKKTAFLAQIDRWSPEPTHRKTRIRLRNSQSLFRRYRHVRSTPRGPGSRYSLSQRARKRRERPLLLFHPRRHAGRPYFTRVDAEREIAFYIRRIQQANDIIESRVYWGESSSAPLERSLQRFVDGA